jgi:transposase InsO family protein
MCKVLKISRTVYYYKHKKVVADTKLENSVIEIFKKSRNNYGTRKIRVELKKQNIDTSRRRIARIMAKYGLVSTYTVKQYKVTRSTCNNEPIQNLVNREFNNRELREVIVSDLTYVNVANSWNYICILIDLHDREIIGYAAGKNKDANLVYKAFTTVNAGLDKFQVFHTDRGNEFKIK